MIIFTDIKEAQEKIQTQVIKTPTTYSTTLSNLLDANVFLKLENLQLTGSYKVRGALNRLMNLTDEQVEIIKRKLATYSYGKSTDGARDMIYRTINSIATTNKYMIQN